MTCVLFTQSTVLILGFGLPFHDWLSTFLILELGQRCVAVFLLNTDLLKFAEEMI